MAQNAADSVTVCVKGGSTSFAYFGNRHETDHIFWEMHHAVASPSPKGATINTHDTVRRPVGPACASSLALSVDPRDEALALLRVPLDVLDVP